MPLGKVLRQVRREVKVDATTEYSLLGARWYSLGLYIKDRKMGNQIKASNLYRVEAGDFVYNRLFAWKGSFAIASKLEHGCFVSNEFPCFEIDRSQLEPGFLQRYFNLEKSWNESLGLSSGATPTSRNRMKEAKLLSIKIPLPPLAEQQWIVARIEELSAKIKEARGLRRQAVEEAEALCRSIVFGDSTAVPTPMYELVKQRGHDVQVKADQTYHFAGVYCFGRGVFRGQMKSGTDFAYKQLGQLKVGNFVYPKLMAWEGAFGVVPTECDGLFVSPEFPIFEVIEERVLPEILDVYFRTPSVWPKVAGESTGTNVRRRRLNPKDFLAYKMPLPSMQTQLRLRQVMLKVNSLKQFQAETSAELDAMLPSILDKAFQGKLFDFLSEK